MRHSLHLIERGADVGHGIILNGLDHHCHGLIRFYADSTRR
jgi:hypothetical protein